MAVGATWASWDPRVRAWARQAKPTALDRALWRARGDPSEPLGGSCPPSCTEVAFQAPSLPTSKAPAHASPMTRVGDSLHHDLVLNNLMAEAGDKKGTGDMERLMMILLYLDLLLKRKILNVWMTLAAMLAGLSVMT